MENSSVRTPGKNGQRIEFIADPQQLVEFDLICQLRGLSRGQLLRFALRQVIIDRGARSMETAIAEIPEFETLSFKQAREFLAPYYNSKPPSTATLIRRIEDGILIAAQDVESRTGPKRILKASLIAWMKRLGKELHDERKI